MRKRIIKSVQEEATSTDQDWLNIEALAEVEITSEDTAYPIESALMPGDAALGWRASCSGTQTVRLLFDAPQRLQRIWLRFVELKIERTQEYVLRWSPDDGKSFQEIVRQQWNFNPQGSSSESEDYHIDLPAVTVLELNIIPDISGRNAFASLAELRLA